MNFLQEQVRKSAPDIINSMLGSGLLSKKAADYAILEISDVFDYDYQEPPHSFAGFVCEECGEMVVEKYGRIKDDKKVCIDCAAKI